MKQRSTSQHWQRRNPESGVAILITGTVGIVCVVTMIVLCVDVMLGKWAQMEAQRLADHCQVAASHLPFGGPAVSAIAEIIPAELAEENYALNSFLTLKEFHVITSTVPSQFDLLSGTPVNYNPTGGNWPRKLYEFAPVGTSSPFQGCERCLFTGDVERAYVQEQFPVNPNPFMDSRSHGHIIGCVVKVHAKLFLLDDEIVVDDVLSSTYGSVSGPTVATGKSAYKMFIGRRDHVNQAPQPFVLAIAPQMNVYGAENFPQSRFRFSDSFDTAMDTLYGNYDPNDSSLTFSQISSEGNPNHFIGVRFPGITYGFGLPHFPNYYIHPVPTGANLANLRSGCYNPAIALRNQIATSFSERLRRMGDQRFEHQVVLLSSEHDAGAWDPSNPATSNKPIMLKESGVDGSARQFFHPFVGKLETSTNPTGEWTCGFNVGQTELPADCTASEWEYMMQLRNCYHVNSRTSGLDDSIRTFGDDGANIQNTAQGSGYPAFEEQYAAVTSTSWPNMRSLERVAPPYTPGSSTSPLFTWGPLNAGPPDAGPGYHGMNISEAIRTLGRVESCPRTDTLPTCSKDSYSNHDHEPAGDYPDIIGFLRYLEAGGLAADGAYPLETAWHPLGPIGYTPYGMSPLAVDPWAQVAAGNLAPPSRAVLITTTRMPLRTGAKILEVRNALNAVDAAYDPLDGDNLDGNKYLEITVIFLAVSEGDRGPLSGTDDVIGAFRDVFETPSTSNHKVIRFGPPRDPAYNIYQPSFTPDDLGLCFSPTTEEFCFQWFHEAMLRNGKGLELAEHVWRERIATPAIAF